MSARVMRKFIRLLLVVGSRPTYASPRASMVKTPLNTLALAQALICSVTVVVVVVAGAALRQHHASMPEGPFMENALYGFVQRVHAAMDGALATLPLLVLVGATVALPRWH